MLNGHLNIFFGKMFIQSICPFKIGLFVLFVIEFFEFLIYLDINPLPDMWFVDIFSHSIGCFFITYFKKICIIYVFLAALGLRSCMGFLWLDRRGLLFSCGGVSCCGAWALGHVGFGGCSSHAPKHGLRSGGARA